MTRISKKQPPEMFYNKGIIRNFPKFTGTRLCWSLCNLLKKRLQQRCFPMNFGKFLRTSFSTEHLPATASLPPMHYPFINHPYIKTRSSSKNTKQIIKAKTLQINEKAYPRYRCAFKTLPSICDGVLVKK